MKKCALVIGHKKSSPGASNENSNLSEFDFNDELAKDIERQVRGVSVQRVYRRTYHSLPSDINELKPDFIISLHCNAFNQEASGTEVLYYHRSDTGKSIAGILLKYLVVALELKNRGVKPKDSEDRGGFLLKRTDSPCLISEPFFIDNDKDLNKALDSRINLVVAYARAIEDIAVLLSIND